MKIVKRINIHKSDISIHIVIFADTGPLNINGTQYKIILWHSA